MTMNQSIERPAWQSEWMDGGEKEKDFTQFLWGLPKSQLASLGVGQ